MAAQQTAADDETETDDETKVEVETTDRPTLTTEYVFERLVMEGATRDGTFYMATGQGPRRRFHAYDPTALKGFDAVRDDDGAIVGNQVANHDDALEASLTKADVKEAIVDPLVDEGDGHIGLHLPPARRTTVDVPRALVVGIACANCDGVTALRIDDPVSLDAWNTGEEPDPLVAFECAHCDDGEVDGVAGAVAAHESADIDGETSLDELDDGFSEFQRADFTAVALKGVTIADRAEARDVNNSTIWANVNTATEKVGLKARD